MSYKKIDEKEVLTSIYECSDVFGKYEIFVTEWLNYEGFDITIEKENGNVQNLS